MRNITIIGAGQSGLQLGIGLLKNGYAVKIISNQTAEQIAAGRITSSQCMFDIALSHERDLGIHYWDEECPWIDGIGFTLDAPDPAQSISWSSRLNKPAQSVDQRVKMPRWMATFEALGGTLEICNAGIPELEAYCKSSDLVIVASGKGEIGRLFERDPERSRFDKPMRALGLTYVTGMTPDQDYSKVGFNLIPGIGEYFAFPALTLSGHCHIMVFEGVPRGPMDCWQGVDSPDQHLEVSKTILQKFAPREAERCANIELTDDLGTLAGRFPPTIKKPVATLPSGNKVLGIADAVCLNDPITGQGSNNASKAANVYLNAILGRGDQGFDEAWMKQTFETYWAIAKYVVQWTNDILEPPEHAVRLLQFANNHQATAHKLVNGFNNPQDYFPWFMEAEAAESYIVSARQAA